MLDKKMSSYSPVLYTIFRVLVGLLFIEHGLMKLFGMFGGNSAPMFSFMWFIGVVEVVVPLLLILGLWTRYAALVGAIDMIGAYLQVHIGQGLIPIMNGGELALLFLAAFLVIIGNGGGLGSIDEKLAKK